MIISVIRTEGTEPMLSLGDIIALGQTLHQYGAVFSPEILSKIQTGFQYRYPNAEDHQDQVIDWFKSRANQLRFKTTRVSHEFLEFYLMIKKDSHSVTKCPPHRLSRNESFVLLYSSICLSFRNSFPIIPNLISQQEIMISQGILFDPQIESLYRKMIDHYVKGHDKISSDIAEVLRKRSLSIENNLVECSSELISLLHHLPKTCKNLMKYHFTPPESAQNVGQIQIQCCLPSIWKEVAFILFYLIFVFFIGSLIRAARIA